MPQLSRHLRTLALAAAALGLVRLPAAAGTNRHFAPGTLTRPCTPCHSSHGIARTPMLRAADDSLCLGCHSSEALSPERKSQLGMGLGARPQDIKSEIAKASRHAGARCLDCHGAHAGSPRTIAAVSSVGMGQILPSTKPGFSNQSELCLSCHGSRGVRGPDTSDLSARFDVTNPSFHPVRATGRGTAVPSLVAPLSTASRINCTDCHGTDTPNGPRGPHGSTHGGLLSQGYARQDGQPESSTAYGLCYACHDRATVLTADPFPFHTLHVVDQKAPCGLCHDPHGVTSSRALVRFNERTPITGVQPARSGTLQFVSTAAGSGYCYLTCHGKNHDPLGYGPGARGLPPPARGVGLAGVRTSVPSGSAATAGAAPAPAGSSGRPAGGDSGRGPIVRQVPESPRNPWP